MELAPVILFAYNRPEHTRKTLESLKKNYLADQSTLYIFVDGPKPEATNEQLEKIEQVKKMQIKIFFLLSGPDGRFCLNLEK